MADKPEKRFKRRPPYMAIRLGTLFHTYGDAVKGVVVFFYPQKIFLELLEMRFHGECGTDIKYSVEVPISHFHTTATITGRASEKKDLFTHTQTISQAKYYAAGTHKFGFEFRFPRREEVKLSPNSEPFTVDNTFYFKYDITATATIVDANNKQHVMTTERYPTFICSREPMIEPISFGTYDCPLAPAKSFGSRIFSLSSPKDSDQGQLAQTELHAELKSPKIIIAKEPFSMSIKIHMDPQFPGQLMPAVQSVRLTKFRICLRSRIGLIAKGHTSEVDLSKNEPMQIASWSAKKLSEAPELAIGQFLNLGQVLNLKTPHYIRATFCNELIRYEYVFRIRAEFDFCGRTYVVDYDNVPVELQPQFVKNDGDEWDYASTPPEELPPLPESPFVPSPFAPSPFSSDESHPSTPPPTFDEVMSERLQPRHMSTDSSMSAMSL
jgi:hypothetical protein